MEKIVVIGTGTMAVGIGAGFIDAGMPVVFLGRDMGRAEATLAAAAKTAAALAAGAAILAGSGANTNPLPVRPAARRLRWHPVSASTRPAPPSPAR